MRRPRVTRSLLLAAAAAWLAAFSAASACRAADSDHPNIVFIIADDCTFRDVGCYGGQAHTPSIDRLATQGMRLTNCFQAAPMCSPTRHNIYTGLYPVKSGAYPNHTFVKPGVKSIVQYLEPLGYRVALSGKKHIAPRKVFAFEYSGGRNPDMEAIDKLFSECAQAGKPFCLFACSNEPHSPWDKGDPSRYPPQTLKLPPNWIDTPETRENYSRYLAEVTYFDGQVGRILGMLEKHRLAGETMVMVVSEQGSSFPFSKWTLYDDGIRSILIVRWPGKIRAGSVSDALVEYVDFCPTFVEAAGGKPGPALEGKSLLPVLFGKTNRHKEYVYALQTTKGIINWLDPYPVRSVRTERYKLILNLAPDHTFRNAAVNGPAFKSWIEAGEKGDERAARRVRSYQHRPGVELYDTAADPYELNNIAGDPRHASTVARLREKLEAWMASQGDKGLATEEAAIEHQTRSLRKAGSLRTKRSRRAPPVHQANGVKIGEVTQDSAIIWTRLTAAPERNRSGTPWPRTPGSKARDDRQIPEGKSLADMEGAVPGASGRVKLVTWRDGDPAKKTQTGWIAVDPERDFTHSFPLNGLLPAERYLFEVRSRNAAGAPGQKVAGTFRTAPPADRSRRIKFTVITGQDYWRRDDDQGGHKIYPSMQALDPDFFVHTGDIEYYDRPRPFATSAALARYKWNRIYAMPYQRAFHEVTPSYFIKDDHDTLKNDCWPGQTYGNLTWEQGKAIFREQVPMGRSTYRTVRWGKDLQIWLVEGRDFRSPNRAPDGPGKTIWGEKQKQWFFETVRASDATFKILISPTPLVGPDRVNKGDNHANAAFAHEGRQLRRFIATQKNMYICCGDRHWQYVSVDPETGVREYSCGPTTNRHAGGWSNDKRSPMHRYLNVTGGFLSVTIEPGADAGPVAIFRHHDIEGKCLNEDRRQAR